MFYARYVLAELRRRRGRTILTALGLGVGVALVVAVTSLSQGLSDAQDKVLEPLTGVGTDMTVSRPLNVRSTRGGNPFGGLSGKERAELQKENGGARVGLSDLGKAGQKFQRETFMTSQLSFSSAKAGQIAELPGVQRAASGLTLNATRISGTVPKTGSAQAGPPGGGGAGGTGGPRNIDIVNLTVSGVDQNQPDLGAITRGQIGTGRYFSSGKAREAILSVGYAKRKGLSVGDKIKLKGARYKVVGIANPPLGGSSSDIYVKLTQLQKASGREQRVNTVYVRAANTGRIGAVSVQIKRTLPGAAVTTTKDLADRVGGSLVDAKNLASKLGTGLAIVALTASILIAMLLTLSSVAKRTKELGTLKAIGWRQAKVVRQVTGESLVQGALGGVVGAALGVGAAALISALGFTLKASVASASTGGGPLGGPLGGAFGQGQVVSGTTNVVLHAPVSIGLVALAIALSVLAGLLAGSVGGLRAARLRPAVALRNLD